MDIEKHLIHHFEKQNGPPSPAGEGFRSSSPLSSSNDAILREIHEELGIEAKIVRPLWFCENFFALDDGGERYHELSLYYLIDASEAKFLFENEAFTLMEENEIHLFEWLPFEKLRDTYFYPLFLKKEIFHLPEHLTMITERKI